jgi:hypothetical protein
MCIFKCNSIVFITSLLDERRRRGGGVIFIIFDFSFS